MGLYRKYLRRRKEKETPEEFLMRLASELNQEANYLRNLSNRLEQKKSAFWINEQKRKVFSGYLKEGLKERDKNQAWLVKEAGVSRETISLYAKGEMLPRRETARKLFRVLGGEYQSLDDFFADKLPVKKEAGDISVLFYDVGIPSYA